MRNISIKTLFLVMSVVALLPLLLQVATVEVITAVITLDLAVTALVILRKEIYNEAIFVFYLLLMYYTFSFPLNLLAGAIDVDAITIIGTLMTRGLVVPDDLFLYCLLAILFKNVFMWVLASSGVLYESRWQLGSESMQGFGITVVLFAVYTSLGLLVDFGFFGVSSQLMLICIVVFLISRLYSYFNENFYLLVTILLALSLLSFCITRSRKGIAVLFIIFAVINGRKYGLYSVKTGMLLLCSLLIVILYGAFRVEKTFDASVLQDQQGVEALGESGNIFLVGSHLVGLEMRHQTPTLLSEGVGAKLVRAIPFVEKEKMLADRYMDEFYPEIGDNGGGFAFPLVAELFITGGLLGVVLGAAALAFLCVRYVRAFSGGTEFVVLLMVAFSVLRCEISLNINYALYLLASLFLIHLIKKFVLLGPAVLLPEGAHEEHPA